MSPHSFSEERLRQVEHVLRQALPEQVTLFIHPDKRAIALFWEPQVPENTIVFFTPTEWVVLLALAECYPHYSPYELLLAHLASTSAEYSRTLLQEAQQRKTVRQVLGPVRDVIKHLRTKLTPFSLAIVSLHGLGYQLTAVASRAIMEKVPQ